MLILILGIIGVIAGIYLAWESHAPREEWPFGRHGKPTTIPRSWPGTAVAALVFSVVGFAAGAFIGGILSLCIYEATVDEVPRQFPIVSLGDGAGAEGHMFLGSGSIDTEAVFFYYAPKIGGGYGLFHVDASQTTIYEDQTDSGYLIKMCEDDNTAPKWLFGHSTDKQERYDCSGNEYSKYEFHIPENSIVRQFNLDAN